MKVWLESRSMNKQLRLPIIDVLPTLLRLDRITGSGVLGENPDALNASANNGRKGYLR
jgi:hypothetical protein